MSLLRNELLATAHPRGFTLWLTGLSGAGKSTLARLMAEALCEQGHRVEILDGDEIRATLSPDLGFSPQDRDTHVKRLGFIANLLARNGVIAIVAAISPYELTRRAVRTSHDAPFIEVFVECPLEELERRDPKQLYRRARAGQIDDLTGVSAPYEAPSSPDIHLRTDLQSEELCIQSILAYLAAQGWI